MQKKSQSIELIEKWSKKNEPRKDIIAELGNEIIQSRYFTNPQLPTSRINYEKCNYNSGWAQALPRSISPLISPASPIFRMMRVLARFHVVKKRVREEIQRGRKEDHNFQKDELVSIHPFNKYY